MLSPSSPARVHANERRSDGNQPNRLGKVRRHKAAHKEQQTHRQSVIVENPQQIEQIGILPSFSDADIPPFVFLPYSLKSAQR